MSILSKAAGPAQSEGIDIMSAPLREQAAVRLARPPEHARAGPPLAGPLPPLPERDARLHAIHYSQQTFQSSPAETQPVSAIVAQHVLTQEQYVFAACQIAEQSGITAQGIPDRLPELEAQLLRNFYGFVAAHPDTVWLHWGMRGPAFGFEVLAQRARRHGLVPVEIPPERRFNLAGWLKGHFGDGYAPHPRLWNAIRQNGVNRPGLLDDDQAAAAWQGGEYAAVLISLSRKVDAIVDLLERLRRGTFRIGAPGDTPERRTGPPAEPGSQTMSATVGAAASHAATPSAAPTASDPEPLPDGPTGGRRPTVNQRMLEQLQHDPASASWSQRTWADFLGCRPSAVAQAPAWQSIVKLRLMEKVERRDRPRG
jgi:hypothetical protein